jgi:hypothetical protein
MRKIAQWFYIEFIQPIRDGYFIWRERRALRQARKIADYLSERSNGKKHVILKDYKGDFVTITKDEFKIMRLKRRGRFAPNVTWSDILNEASYITA